MKLETYIYGGTLDPIHEGHLGVLRETLHPERLLVIAPTAKNPWKQEQPTPLHHRMEMIRLVCQCEKLPLRDKPDGFGLYLSGISYEYVCDFVADWREENDGVLTWVVGPDTAPHVSQWKDWDTLNLKLYVSSLHADDARAKKVRSGEQQAHPAIREYIARNRLYR